ncbi:MAG: heat shock protein HspQ [Gammaproteobacteria bacterium]|nr:heat shock protein HspQ [Gammaproteobacteria bacterium]
MVVRMKAITASKFSIGELIHHRLFDYRGVIVDVDQEFSGSEEWYNSVAKSRPPKDQPWYHVLVHGGSHTTYVAERNLEADTSVSPIDHPLVKDIFTEFSDGKYVKHQTLN